MDGEASVVASAAEFAVAKAEIVALGAAENARAAASPSAPGLFEIRTYMIKPELLAEYLERCEDTAATRRALCPGFLGFWVTEAGHDVNQVTHVYHYLDYDHRDATRAAMKVNEEWQEFLAASTPALARPGHLSRPHWPPSHLSRPHWPPCHMSRPHWPPLHLSRPLWLPRHLSRPHWPPRHLSRPLGPPRHLSRPHWLPSHLSRPHWMLPGPARWCHR